jgi:glycosyltransferase involved in cell wall biosynthesis
MGDRHLCKCVEGWGGESGDEILMLRVLTVSSLFPDSTRPTFGIFVEKQTLGLAAHRDVDLRVVAPIGVPPALLRQFSALHRGLSTQPRHEVWKGLEVYRPLFTTVPLVEGRWSALSMWWALLPILDEIRRDFPFDVIDTEFFFPDGPAAMRLADRYDVPFSIKARGADISFWAGKAACRRQIVAAGQTADGLLAVSGALREEMISLGMPADRITVHHTGVDQRAFRPTDRTAAKASLDLSGPVVLTVGHLIPRKGQTLVIDAMTSLPDATLLIVGDGPDRHALEQQITANRLQDRVHMLGPKAHADLPALFAAADVMVSPSTSEGLANVWVESLACGTPIVITDIGGAREVVDRPAAGRIVERNAAAIAAGIAEVLVNPATREETAAAAKRFTWERNTEALYAHLKGLVNKAPPFQRRGWGG